MPTVSPAANTTCGTWGEHCCWIPPTPEEWAAHDATPALVIGQCPYLRDDGATWRTKKLARRWCCTLIEAACAIEGTTDLTAAVKTRVRATQEHKAIVKRIHDHLTPAALAGTALTWTDCLDWPGTRTCNLCARTNGG